MRLSAPTDSACPRCKAGGLFPLTRFFDVAGVAFLLLRSVQIPLGNELKTGSRLGEYLKASPCGTLHQVWREPMFEFEIDQALFEFAYARPQCEPLFA